MSKLKLSIAVRNAMKEAEKAKGTTSRDILDDRIQGFILNPRVIFSEMLHPKSPFQIKLGGDKIHWGSNLRKMARDISSDLWQLFQDVARNSSLKVYKGSIKNPPKGFKLGGERAVLFDESTKIMYVTSPKNTFTILRDELNKKVKDKLATRNGDDITRVFYFPNEEWPKAVNKLTNKILEDEGLTEKPGQDHPRYKAVENKIYRELRKLRKSNLDYEGIQLGHSFGAAVFSATAFLSNIHDLSHVKNLKDIELLHGIPEQFHAEIYEIIQQSVEVDASFKWERVFGKNTNHAEFTLIFPQDKVTNQSTGGSLGTIKSRLDKLAKILIKNIDFSNLEGSPSYNKLLAEKIENIFLGKPIKTKKYITTGKVRDRTTNRIPVYKAQGAKPGVRYKEKRNKKTESEITTLRLLNNVINPELHDKIKENMGKGKSKQILNYRTGRFARSAKAIDILPSREKGAIKVLVKYHGFPYTRFETGGDLWKPGRDPKRIFGRSIRQILQEKKIANLRRVEVRLQGG